MTSEQFAGESLQQLVDRNPRDILGTVPLRRPSHRFPLLTKFIDARQPLSVQVHPNDAEAQRLEGQPNGKTEAWHIIEATPDAWIIHGMSQAIEPETFRERLEAGTADDLLRKVPAVAGETIFVPARTVHAIGPGVLLHEIQQTSDVTYRLYDWNRQSQGSKRQLHLDKGLKVAWLKPSPPPVVRPVSWIENDVVVSCILATEYFTVKRVILPGKIDLDTGGKSFHIITVIEGSCAIHSQSEATELSVGQSAVLPACLGRYTLGSQKSATVLIEFVADISVDLVPELLAYEIPSDEVNGFLAQFTPIPAA